MTERNHEYALAVPLHALYARASQPEAQCRTGARSGEPPPCALRRVEETLCPCIRGEACVCRALASELARRMVDEGAAPEPTRMQEEANDGSR